MSSTSICSMTFICEVLTVTVTWSGLGSSSASMWRVSSDSHLACRAFGLGREGDRAADLDDHVRHGLAHAGDQLVEHGQALGALAVELAHVQVQRRGAGVVAVHRLLDLRFHRDRDVFRKVRRHPLGAVRCGGDDELVLVFGEQGSVEEVHGRSFSRWVEVTSVDSTASRASSSASRMGAATHMLCSPCRQASCSTAVISSRRRRRPSARAGCAGARRARTGACTTTSRRCR